MRFALFLIIAMGAPAFNRAFAQGPVGLPAYQRTRGGGNQMTPPDGRWRRSPRGYGDFGGYYNPYYYPYFMPIVAGTWYQRPYPYHFDYYKYRWGQQGTEPGPPTIEDMIPAVECPCLGTQTTTGDAPSAEATPAAPEHIAPVAAASTGPSL